MFVHAHVNVEARDRCRVGGRKEIEVFVFEEGRGACLLSAQEKVDLALPGLWILGRRALNSQLCLLKV